MTIDERLEALAQSVELLTHDVHQMQVLHKDHEKLMREMMGETMLAITQLANTASAHNGQ